MSLKSIVTVPVGSPRIPRLSPQAETRPPLDAHDLGHHRRPTFTHGACPACKLVVEQISDAIYARLVADAAPARRAVPATPFKNSRRAP
jgi:hypothetical protein